MASLFDKFKQGVIGLKDKAYGAATSVAKNIFGSIPKQPAPTFKSDLDGGFSSGGTRMAISAPPKKASAPVSKKAPAVSKIDYGPPAPAKAKSVRLAAPPVSKGGSLQFMRPMELPDFGASTMAIAPAGAPSTFTLGKRAIEMIAPQAVKRIEQAETPWKQFMAGAGFLPGVVQEAVVQPATRLAVGFAGDVATGGRFQGFTPEGPIARTIFGEAPIERPGQFGSDIGLLAEEGLKRLPQFAGDDPTSRAKRFAAALPFVGVGGVIEGLSFDLGLGAPAKKAVNNMVKKYGREVVEAAGRDVLQKAFREGGEEGLERAVRNNLPDAARAAIPESRVAAPVERAADDVVEDLISPARREFDLAPARAAEEIPTSPARSALRETDEPASPIARSVRQIDETAPSAARETPEQFLKRQIGETFNVVEPSGRLWKSRGNTLFIQPTRENPGFAAWLRQRNFVASADEAGNNIYRVVLKDIEPKTETAEQAARELTAPVAREGSDLQARLPLDDVQNIPPTPATPEAQPLNIQGVSSALKESASEVKPTADIFEGAIGPQRSAEVTERIIREAEGLPADLTARTAKVSDGRLKLKTPEESKAAKIAVDQVGPEYTPASRRIADLFADSKNQKSLGERGGVRFEIGSFGKSHQARKLTENKIDRFPEGELEETINNIVQVFRASNDPKMYRFDNLAWVAEMPNGETRMIYTRVNANGAEEIIGWHVLDQTKKAKYLDNLASFGTPTGSRTRITGLEDRGFNPLAYGGDSEIPRSGAGGNGAATPSIFPKRSGRELERGFVTSVKDSPQTAKEVAETVKGTYTELRNPELLAKAQAIIDGNMDEAVRLARGSENTPEANAVGMLLMNRYQQAGDYQAAIDVAEAVARRSTTAGQAIQALTIWGRLTPEGALSYAQRVIDRANDAGAGSRLRSKLKLTPDDAKTIQDFAKRIQKMPEGQEKAVEVAKLMDFIASKIPPTLLAKVSTLQTMAQLLNPKTMIRNLVGNLGFAALEQVSDVLGTAVDAGLSLLTKQRSKVLPSAPAQIKGFQQGWKLGLEDALKGIDTSGVVSKFDGSVSPSALEHVRGRVFRSGLLGKAETAMSVALRGTDRAFYQGAFDGTVDNMLRARGVTKLSDVDEPVQRMIIESAHAEALRRTFQDDNALSRMMSRIKKALNGGKEWGVGDLLLKYPKTPAAIIMRGLEYTPVGFTKAAYEAALPLIGGKVSPVAFNQKKFVDAFSRATVGTGILGVGYALANLGILEGKPEKPKDVANLEREVGLGDYKINVSALKRFVMGGFSPEAATRQNGDVLVSYDWFQPNSIMMAMGANIAQNMKGKGEKQAVEYLGTMADGLLQGVDTLAEQPLFQGMRQFMQSRDVPTALRTIVTNMPASFVPTFFNQIKQLTDNVSREAYDPNMFVEAKNRAISKVPGLSRTLPERVTVFGDTKETYQGGTNNPFNVLINPAFVSKVQESPEAKLALDLYKSIGETKQVPNQISRTQQAYGESWKLSGADIGEMQRYVGERSKNVFTQLAENPRFAALPDETKVSLLSRLLTRFGKEAKAQAYLDHIEVTPPEKITPPVQAKILDRVYKSDRFKSASPQQRKVILERVFSVVANP